LQNSSTIVGVINEGPPEILSIFTYNGTCVFAKKDGVYRFGNDEFSKANITLKNGSGTILTNNHRWHYVSMEGSTGWGITDDGRNWLIQTPTEAGADWLILTPLVLRGVGKLTRENWYTVERNTGTVKSNIGSNAVYYYPNIYNPTEPAIDIHMEKGDYSSVIAINKNDSYGEYYFDTSSSGPYGLDQTCKKIDCNIIPGQGKNSIIFDKQQQTYIILPYFNQTLTYIKDDPGEYSSEYDELLRVKTVEYQIPISKNWVDHTARGTAR